MKADYIQNLLYFLSHSKLVTRSQKMKFERLVARDIINKTASSPIINELSVLNTARFLAEFNNPMGLKYLTHDFDYIDDGRPNNIESLINMARQVIGQNHQNIPGSLRSLLNAFVNGRPWTDTFGNSHNSSISNKDWIKWSVNNNNMHPINNVIFSKEIRAFRSTIRLVTDLEDLPLLQKIIENKKRDTNLNIICEKTDKADFYTNTFILNLVLRKILTMMNKRCTNSPNVRITYKRSKDDLNRRFCQIIITQEDSYGDKSIDSVISRLRTNPEAGDLGSIRNNLNGYCYWSIETKWDGTPCKWNILRERNQKEIEDLPLDQVKGFTHILTFFIV